MTEAVAFTITFVACLIGLLLMLRQSPHFRFGLNLAALAVISAALWHEGQSPLVMSAPSVGTEAGLWLRLLAIGWWFLACRIVARVTRALLGHDQRSRETRLFSDLLAALIYVAATLVVLDLIFKLPIGGLVATSGLAAVVVGLALQNTLADVFAGIAVGIEQPFRVGDRVCLRDGVEGLVVQMNWRSIRLRTNRDDLVVIPNSAIAKAEIINRSSPTESGIAKVELVVAAAADPELVFELLRAAVLLTPGTLAAPAPVTLLLRLGERTAGYAVQFPVADVGQLDVVKSTVLHHVRRGLNASGLVGGSSANCGGRLLRATALFECLPDNQILKLQSALHFRRVAVGAAMIDEQSAEPLLYLIAGGVIEVSHDVGGRRETIGRVGAGGHVGDIGVLSGRSPMVRATALTEVRAYTLAKAALMPLLAEYEELAATFEQSLLRGRAVLEGPLQAANDTIGNPPEQLLGRIRRFFVR